MFEYYHSEDRQPTPPFGQPFGQQFSPPFGLPFGQQFGPPFGPPGVSPGGPSGPPFGPPSQGAASGPPSGPPPSFVPSQAQALQGQGPGTFAISPGAIRPCLFRYIFIWLNTGERFWAWLVFVDRRSAAGWRWTGFRWVFFGVDLRNIESFICY